jgi:hypothetical protein
MKHVFSLFIFAVGVMQAQPRVGGAGSAGATAAQTAEKPDAVAAGEDALALPLSLIESKARTLAGVPDGSGSIYSFVTDRDLMGKSSEKALQQLSGPRINAQDHIRNAYVLINLNASWKFVSTNGQPVNVGTAIVDSRVRQLEVNTGIFANGGLTVQQVSREKTNEK